MGIEDEFYEYLAETTSKNNDEKSSVEDLHSEAILELLSLMSSLDAEERNQLRELFQDLATNMTARSETYEERQVPSDLLFVGTDGQRVVKGLHYSREALGEDGPIIFPSSSEFVIIGAFSDEFISRDADEISELYDTLDEKNEAWEQMMINYAQLIARAHDENPPGGLEDFLKNID